MQFFSVSQQPKSLARPPAALPVQPEVVSPQRELEAETCGWYGSSFDLGAGLEISEQEDDLLYQLCTLCH